MIFGSKGFRKHHCKNCTGITGGKDRTSHSLTVLRDRLSAQFMLQLFIQINSAENLTLAMIPIYLRGEGRGEKMTQKLWAIGTVASESQYGPVSDWNENRDVVA